MRRNLILAAMSGILPVIVACTGAEDEAAMDTEDVAEASAASTTSEASEASLESATTNGVSLGGKPEAYVQGYSLSVKGSLYGLNPYKDVHVKVFAKAIAEARCINPGGNEPPGQNPVFRTIDVSGHASFSAWQIKFGFLKFVVKTLNPPKEILGAPDCPNPRWTEKIVALKFISFKIIIEQPKGYHAYSKSCTCPPTSSGQVKESDLSCS
jgi:hypothetical protein